MLCYAVLTYLMKTPEPIGQQGRWLDLLSEYDCMTSPSSIDLVRFTVIAMLCHGDLVNGVKTQTVNSAHGQPGHLLQYLSLALHSQQMTLHCCQNRSTFCHSIHNLTSLQTCLFYHRQTLHLTKWSRWYPQFRRMNRHTLCRRMTSWHGNKCSRFHLSLHPSLWTMSMKLNPLTTASNRSCKP